MTSDALAAEWRRVAASLDGEAPVVLPAGVLLRLLSDAAAAPAPAEAMARDLDCQQAGDLLGRKASTIRAWCAAGRLRGYRQSGREWRIPSEAIEECRARAARGDHSAPAALTLARGKSVSLKRWRGAHGERRTSRKGQA